MMEGSGVGSGSVPLTKELGSRSKRPQKLRIWRIRIRNTDKPVQEVGTVDFSVIYFSDGIKWLCMILLWCVGFSTTSRSLRRWGPGSRIVFTTSCSRSRSPSGSSRSTSQRSTSDPTYQRWVLPYWPDIFMVSKPIWVIHLFLWYPSLSGSVTYFYGIQAYLGQSLMNICCFFYMTEPSVQWNK